MGLDRDLALKHGVKTENEGQTQDGKRLVNDWLQEVKEKESIRTLGRGSDGGTEQ